jgi:hypothetical protein
MSGNQSVKILFAVLFGRNKQIYGLVGRTDVRVAIAMTSLFIVYSVKAVERPVDGASVTLIATGEQIEPQPSFIGMASRSLCGH